MLKPKVCTLIEYLRFALLSLSIIFTSSCGFGPYFTDDGVRIARDAKTGEYIGYLVGKCTMKDFASGKEVIYYKIERQDGSRVEVPAEQVQLLQE
jgi:hypothetical protein